MPKKIRRFMPNCFVKSALLNEYTVSAGWHTYIKTFEKAEMLSGFTALIFTRIYPGIAVRSIMPTKMSVVKKACIRKFILPVRPFSFCANVCACPRTP